MTIDERIAILESRIQVLEDKLKQNIYELPDLIPNDKDAPEWAKWKAMDMDGEWWWYSKEPRLVSSCWVLHIHLYSTSGDKITNINKIDPEYWKNSLTKIDR